MRRREEGIFPSKTKAEAMPNDAHHLDGGSPGSPIHGPDGHGRAALLLIESLIHGLIAKSVLTTAEAIEIIEIAADVEGELGLLDAANSGLPSLLTPLADTLVREAAAR